MRECFGNVLPAPAGPCRDLEQFGILCTRVGSDQDAKPMLLPLVAPTLSTGFCGPLKRPAPLPAEEAYQHQTCPKCGVL